MWAFSHLSQLSRRWSNRSRLYAPRNEASEEDRDIVDREKKRKHATTRDGRRYCSRSATSVFFSQQKQKIPGRKQTPRKVYWGSRPFFLSSSCTRGRRRRRRRRRRKEEEIKISPETRMASEEVYSRKNPTRFFLCGTSIYSPETSTLPLCSSKERTM